MNKIGKTYGRLIVISSAGKVFLGGQLRSAFKCKCQCGNEVIKLGQNLVKNRMSSCGCWSKEQIKKLAKLKGKARFWNYKHGMFGTRFYGIYNGLVQRCNNINSQGYRFYGALGIKSEFADFNDFKKSMYPSYQKHVAKYGIKETTIDRINSMGNYSVKNCRWSTYKEQANNRKDNLLLDFDGEIHTLSQWANKFKTSNYLAYKKITGLDYNK